MSSFVRLLGSVRAFPFRSLLILACAAPSLSWGDGQWEWVSGANMPNAAGNYGTKGVASATNVPPPRTHAVSWRATDGNFWIFGGLAKKANGSLVSMNDLWKFDPATGNWTWVSGSDPAGNRIGIYGTKGTAASGNTPGGREGAAAWRDASGNLWLFGGLGEAATTSGILNDLWKYDPQSGLWTWVSGSNTANQTGTYGTIGVAAASNVPGGRDDPVFWPDANGVFWIFGGNGCDSTQCGVGGDINKRLSLNDLWKFNPAGGTWTWVSGNKNYDAVGDYGTKGTSAASNLPPGRRAAGAWNDCLGNLWMYGGSDFYLNAQGALTSDGTQNDLWEFSPSTGQWTWISGAKNSTPPAKPVYGTLGAAAVANTPGSREYAASWVDPYNNLWLFGGLDLSITGADGVMNDLWRYSIADGTWTWFGGSSAVNATGTYGTQGIAAAGNTPGSRSNATAFTDGFGSLWLLGGGNMTQAAMFNDLWEFTPPAAKLPLSCNLKGFKVGELPSYFKILFGVTNDGGGVGVLPGKGLVHIPPRTPEGPILLTLEKYIGQLVQQAAIYDKSQANSRSAQEKVMARQRREALTQAIEVLNKMEASLKRAVAAESKAITR
jgi:Galactose oxidase, central domain